MNLHGELENVNRQLEYEERAQLDPNRKIFKRLSTTEELKAAAQGKGEGCMICFQEFSKKRKQVQCQFCAKCCCSECCHRHRANPQAESKSDMKALICDDCSRQYMTVLLNHDFYEEETLLKQATIYLEHEVEKLNQECTVQRQRIERERQKKEDPENLKKVMKLANLKKQLTEGKKELDKLDKEVVFYREQVNKLQKQCQVTRNNYVQEQRRIQQERRLRELDEQMRKQQELRQQQQELSRRKMQEEREALEAQQLDRMTQERMKEDAIRQLEEQLRAERIKKQQLEEQINQKRQAEKQAFERQQRKREEDERQQALLQKIIKQQREREQAAQQMARKSQMRLKQREEEERILKEKIQREIDQSRKRQEDENERKIQQKLQQERKKRQKQIDDALRKAQEQRQRQMQWYRQEEQRRQREQEVRLEEEAAQKKIAEEEQRDRQRLMEMFRNSTMSDDLLKQEVTQTTVPERTVSISEALAKQADILNFRVKPNNRPIIEARSSIKSETTKKKDAEAAGEEPSKHLTKEDILRSSSFAGPQQEDLTTSHIDEGGRCKCSVF